MNVERIVLLFFPGAELFWISLMSATVFDSEEDSKHARMTARLFASMFRDSPSCSQTSKLSHHDLCPDPVILCAWQSQFETVNVLLACQN